MRRQVSILVLVGLGHLCGYGATERSVSINTSMKSADLEGMYLNAFQQVIERIKDQGFASIPDHSGISDPIKGLIEGKVLGLTARQRRALVMKAIGHDDYSVLKQLLLKQLGAADADRQRIAIDLLGYPLFAVGAADEIKAFALNSDRATQYRAVKSLVALDVAGADHLLVDMLLSGALQDYASSQAFEVLYVCNYPQVDGLAMKVLEMKPGGATFKALLPVLKNRKDYREVLASVFTSNMFYVPDREDLTLEQHAKRSAEHAILVEIIGDPAFFMDNDKVREKILKYADTTCNNVYVLPLVILEKSGQELAYFTNMPREKSIPSAKKALLEKIISRIQAGRRLR